MITIQWQILEGLQRLNPRREHTGGPDTSDCIGEKPTK